MDTRPIIYVVCSDRHRNGKTLLARVLVDYLMLDGRDPFVIDADPPEGPLRGFFPGRTVLVDFDQMQGRVKLFDTILDSPGRDYVIDLPAAQTGPFFQALRELDFVGAAHAKGFRIVVLFIVDRSAGSARAAEDIRLDAGTDLVVDVGNVFVGSGAGKDENRAGFVMPVLAHEAAAFIAGKRFSLRSFLLGEEQGLAPGLVMPLKSFLYEVMTGLREIEPALSAARLRT